MRAALNGVALNRLSVNIQEQRNNSRELQSMDVFPKISLFPLIALLLMACSNSNISEAAQPTNLVDATGTIVMLARPATRIISLGPSNTEILFALDAGTKIVGVDDFSNYPIEATTIEKVGAPFPSFDLERIVFLKPDLVISTELAEFNTTLRGLTIPVYVSNPQDIEEVFKVINDIGILIHHSEKASTLTAQMSLRISNVQALTANSAATKVFYEVDASDPTRPYTVGAPSFVTDIIAISGGTNIFNDVGIAYPQVSLEEVVARDPDFILLADAYAPVNPQSIETAARRPGWKSIAAVKAGNMVPVNPDIISRPGPRLADGIESLAELLHPHLFIDAES
jgi:iron complex transport system substrate-binding protein